MSFKVKALITMMILAILFLPLVSHVIQAQPRYGGTLVWGLSSEPPNLVPIGPPTWAFQVVGNQISNPLVNFDPVTFEWQPELAESWESTTEGDRMTIKFNLVKNATWHDGKPFTSADVKFTYEEIAPVFNSFLAGMKEEHLESIETPDDYTVIFKFKDTWAGAIFPNVFGGCGTGIMPKHLYEGTDYSTNPYNMKTIGTGPYKFKEWKAGEYIILERNENYWKKGLPYLDRIIYKIIPSSSAMALAFEKGEVDFIWSYGLTFTDAVQLQEMIGIGKLLGKKVWFWPSPCASVDTMGFNLHDEGSEYLKDVRVRKAIAAAIDRRTLGEVAYLNRTEAMVETVLSSASANFLYYDPSIKQQTYDPELAKTLLDEAGYTPGPDGVRFSLRLTVDPVAYPANLKEAELIRDMLGEVGIDVQIITLETATWHETVYKNWDFDMSILPFCYGPGPSYFIRYFSTKGIARASWTNAMGYSNLEFDNLLYQAELEPDREKHIDLMKQALKIMADDQPAVFLCTIDKINALNLEFSDELQPGAWESSGGQAYQRLEGVYWVKAPLTQEVEVEVIPTWVYVVIAVAVIVAVGSIIYAIRKR